MPDPCTGEGLFDGASLTFGPGEHVSPVVVGVVVGGHQDQHGGCYGAGVPPPFFPGYPGAGVPGVPGLVAEGIGHGYRLSLVVEVDVAGAGVEERAA